jgi:hypothetical protein
MSTAQSGENYSVDRGLQVLPTNEITKLKLQGNIVLGDFIFNTIDSDGVVWVITDIKNWWTLPSADMPNIARGFGDGSYDVQGRYQSRDLSLDGVFLTSDPAKVEAARDRLIAACNLVYKGAWLKTGNDPIRASFVRLSGSVDIQTVNARGRTEFSIGLRAADPIKYEWNDATPNGYTVTEIPVSNVTAGLTGSGDVVNIGNYPVPAIYEVSGPLTAPATIYNRNTDKLIIITQGLKGSITRSITNKQLTFNTTSLEDIATLTTLGAHGFSVGDSLYISNIGYPFDGDQTVISVPTDTTFTYVTESAVVKNVVFKSLQNSIAEITTTVPHTYEVGDTISVLNVDSVFDGEYTILDTPTDTTFTYVKTRTGAKQVVSKLLVANIATLTTSEEHNFIVGDTASISGVDVNFNGNYTITAVPTSTSFSYAATRTNARAINSYSVANPDIATFVTSLPHGFVLDEQVAVSGVNSSIDNVYTITGLPTSSKFDVVITRSTEKIVSTSAISSGVATLTTSTPHGYLLGEKVYIGSSEFAGLQTITSLPSTTTFTFTTSSPNRVTTSFSDIVRVRSASRVVKERQLVGGVVTLSTTAAHGAYINENITVTGLGSEFDGNYVVTSTPSATSLTYTKSGPNVAAAVAPANSFVATLGTAASTPIIPDGSATVSGSLPVTGASGTVSVSDVIVKTQASGKSVKKNDVIFTPGIQNATAILSADVLEIDTQNREVAFNGVVEGARGRIDVLADFITLEPGSNTLEFIDEGNPEGEATLRVYYRSGWLG